MNDKHKDRVTVIVQARMKSTRLPGKTLKKVLGQPLLFFLIERLKRSKTVNKIVVATTIDSSDNPIVELAQQLSIPFYRGSEDDVFSRYVEVGKLYQTDLVVRITADCPLMDPEIIDFIVEQFQANKTQVDYASNTLKRTYPRGYDVEVVSFDTLKNVAKRDMSRKDKEHVTYFIYNNPELYRLKNIVYKEDLSHLRLTVDTLEDFELIKNIIESLYPKNPNFTMNDVVDLLIKHPNWVEINSHIKQKNN